MIITHSIKRYFNTGRILNLTDDYRQIISKLKSNFSPEKCESILSSSIHDIDLTKKMSDRKYFVEQISSCPIKNIEIFSLAANKPGEDFWNIGVNQVRGTMSSLLFSVFDGHSGHQCAQFINRAALEFVAASILDHEKLDLVSKLIMDPTNNEGHLIVRRFLPGVLPIVPKILHSEMVNQLIVYIQLLLQKSCNSTVISENSIDKCMIDAFENLDKTIDSIVRLGIKSKSKDHMRLGLSGSVGMVGRISWIGGEPNLFLSNTGDSSAAIFSRSPDSGKLFGRLLTVAHTADNPIEVNRLISEHPSSESINMVKENRLLGELQPLRAFGDIRYKWSKKDLNSFSMSYFDSNEEFYPNGYHTPPYLTAKPEIIRHKISKNDEFILIGSDGLWDVLPVQDLAFILDTYSQEKVSSQKLMCKATENEKLVHTIAKYALGAIKPDHTVSYDKLSSTLSLPFPLARNFRDDMTYMLLSTKAIYS